VSQPITRAEASVEDERLRQLELLTRWLDRRYVDPILGLLLPGAGDLVGAALGLVGIVTAFRMRAHPLVIARMLINLALDALLGALPGVGDVADFLYRANQRNLELLEQRSQREVRSVDWLIVLGAALGFLLALCVPVLLVMGVFKAVFAS
jgi:hypothetical protein